MKTNKTLNSLKEYFINDIFGTGIGWLAGLISVKLMSNFFEQKNWSNIWGFWSDKIILEKQTYEVSEKIITIIAGFIVMNIVNTLIKTIFSNKKHKN